MEEFLGQYINALIPKSLDDIIRLNRDKALLRLAAEDEVMELHAQIRPSNPKGIFEDWRFIAFEFRGREVELMLLGDVYGTSRTRITSAVRKIDLDRQLVITNSGSLYQLRTPGHGEPSRHQLINVCSAFHSWGMGDYPGVPHFFY